MMRSKGKPDPTQAPVPMSVHQAARRILDDKAVDSDFDVLRAWYFRDRVAGPAGGAKEVAAWAIFMANDHGIIQCADTGIEVVK